MKIKTFGEFKKTVKEQYGWNAAIGFWHVFVYEQYKQGLKTWDDALSTMKSFEGYTGV